MKVTLKQLVKLGAVEETDTDSYEPTDDFEVRVYMEQHGAERDLVRLKVEDDELFIHAAATPFFSRTDVDGSFEVSIFKRMEECA